MLRSTKGIKQTNDRYIFDELRSCEGKSLTRGYLKVLSPITGNFSFKIHVIAAIYLLFHPISYLLFLHFISSKCSIVLLFLRFPAVLIVPTVPVFQASYPRFPVSLDTHQSGSSRSTGLLRQGSPAEQSQF